MNSCKAAWAFSLNRVAVQRLLSSCYFCTKASWQDNLLEMIRLVFLEFTCTRSFIYILNLDFWSETVSSLRSDIIVQHCTVILSDKVISCMRTSVVFHVPTYIERKYIGRERLITHFYRLHIYIIKMQYYQLPFARHSREDESI